ncbi:hypothetical protein V8G54_034885, partial [Vigna mungo]
SRESAPHSEVSPFPLPLLELAVIASGSQTRVAPATRLTVGAVATQFKASPATPTINRINREREGRTTASMSLIPTTTTESNHRCRPWLPPLERRKLPPPRPQLVWFHDMYNKQKRPLRLCWDGI